MQAQTLYNLHDKTKMKLEAHNSEHYQDLFWFEQFVHLVTLGITIIADLLYVLTENTWNLASL